MGTVAEKDMVNLRLSALDFFPFFASVVQALPRYLSHKVILIFFHDVIEFYLTCHVTLLTIPFLSNNALTRKMGWLKFIFKKFLSGQVLDF